MREILPLVARHDRLEHSVPSIGAVNVAGTQSAAFEVPKLVEHEQRVIAGAGVMAVPDALLLLAMGRAHARIHVEHDATRRPSAMHKVDPPARQVGKSSEVLGRREPLRRPFPAPQIRRIDDAVATKQVRHSPRSGQTPPVVWANRIDVHERLGSSELATPYRSLNALASSVRPSASSASAVTRALSLVQL